MNGWFIRLLPYLKHREYLHAVPNDPRIGFLSPWRTNLPVKCETRLKDEKDGQEVLHTLRYDEFKTKDRLTHFIEFKFQRNETTKRELEMGDINPQETLDDSVFVEPEKR